MLTPNEYADKYAYACELRNELRQVEHEMLQTRDELFAPAINERDDDGKVLSTFSDMLHNKISLRAVNEKPHSVPSGKWCNIAPGRWIQRI